MSNENIEVSQEAPRRGIVVETSDGSHLEAKEEKEAEAPKEDAEKVEAKAEEADAEDAQDSATEEKAEDVEAESEDEESEEDAEDDEEKEDDDKEEKSEKDEGKKRKRRGGFKRRIDKLSKQKADLEAERDYWRRQAMTGKGEDAGEVKAEENIEAPQMSADGRPDPDNFETVEEYTDALVEWKLDQREAKAQEKAKAEKAKSAQSELLESHTSRVEAYRAQNPDYDEALADIADIPTSIGFEQYILNSDNGPAILYELSDDPDKVEAICKMPYQRAQMELARIEARLVDKPSAKEKEVETKTEVKAKSKAPAPPSPVGKGKAAPKKDPDEMSYQEYKRWRAAGGR